MENKDTLLVLKSNISIAIRTLDNKVRVNYYDTPVESNVVKVVLPVGTIVRVIGVNKTKTKLFVAPINDEQLDIMERNGYKYFEVGVTDVTAASGAAKVLYGQS